jgi:hydrogenase nickel incorporation protein HypB
MTAHHFTNGRIVDPPTPRLALAGWLEALLGPLRAHRLGHEEFAAPEGDEATADVLAAVRERAGEVHDRLAHEHDVFTVEFVGSTGGGKTRLIERLLERTPPAERVGAVVGDVSGEDDANRLREYDIPVANVTTGKDCHLDPDGLDTALSDFDLAELDTLYVENVGNMVCPADFPLGASLRVLVVSTTEGEDVVGKHPLLVQAVDAAVINKVDLAAAVGTDLDRMRRDFEQIAPELPVFETDADAGTGLDRFDAFVRSQREHDHRHDLTRRPGHEHDTASEGGDGARR